MVIDEISMLSCKIMEVLHKQLSTAKANPELPFGGINILLFGDFLQLPAVRSSDVYVYDRKYGLGHRLWRSLTAVVILKEQMRQAEDPLYAAIFLEYDFEFRQTKILKFSGVGLEPACRTYDPSPLWSAGTS
jgi:PIF1-like helicase